MTLLNKIANQVSPALGGIDWELLEQQLGMPREEIVYDTTGAVPGASGLFRYADYILEAHKRCEQAFSRFIFTWKVSDNPQTAEMELKEAAEAWQEVQHDTVAIGDHVLSALRANAEFLSSESEFVVDRERFRAMVSSTYYTTLYGAVVHAKAFLQLASVAPEDIVENADSIVKTFNGLTKMAEMGVLDSMMTQPVAPTSPNAETLEVVEGTGAIPVAVVVAVAAVVAVAIIAWCIVAVVQQQETNRAIKLMCEEAARTGNEADKARCADLVKMNITATQGAGIAAAAKSIGEAAVMVALAYGAFLLLPPLVKAMKFKQTRAEA